MMLGWVLFRAPTLGGALNVYAAMAGAHAIETPAQIATLLSGKTTLLLLVTTVGIFAAPNTWEIDYPRTRWAAVLLAAVLLWCTLRFANPSPFLYFQF